MQSRRLSWGAALLIVVLVCALSFAGAYIYDRWSSSGEFGSSRVVELPANYGLQTAGDGFVAYDGSSLSSISTKGETRWTYAVGSSAQFDASTDGVAVWSGQVVTLIDWAKGVTLYSSAMDVDVLSAKIGSKYAATVLSPEREGSVVLMEHGGRKVDTISVSGKIVLDYGFFSEGSLFWLMTLDTSGTVPTCEITTYQPGKRTVGSISDTEQLMYQVMPRATQLCCVGVSNLKVYDYLGTEDLNQQKLIYGWYLVSIDENSYDPMMAYVLSSQYDADGSMRDVRMISSSVDQVVRMPFACSSLMATDARVYGFSSDGYIMVAEAGRQKVNAYPVNLPIERVYGITSDNVAVIGSGSLVYLVNLL